MNSIGRRGGFRPRKRCGWLQGTGSPNTGLDASCFTRPRRSGPAYGRLKEALPHLELAQNQAPATDNGGPARMLGRVYQETPGGLLLGSKPEAIKWYKKSLEVSPDAISTHLWLGEAYLADNQPALARAELERASAIKPRGGREKEEGEYRKKAGELLRKLPVP